MTSSRRRWAHENSECGGEGDRAPEARKEMAPSPEWGLREEGGGNLWWLKGRDPKHIPGVGQPSFDGFKPTRGPWGAGVGVWNLA